MDKQNLAPCLALLGTGSDVGKSVTSSALCRIFSNMGIKNAPFKAQNMSNNSFVTAMGGEMGRAQVVQAECARIEPHVDMNPLLLKPGGNSSSQMILDGKAVGNVTSEEFRSDRSSLFKKVMKSLDRLRADYDLVVIEGAGSCAEVNLRDYDIANFRTAIYCNAPVLLVADIDRGGVFAQVTGTLALLEPMERALVKGIIINRFRGDATLFDEGLKFLENKTGLPVLGLVLFFDGIEIDMEDSLALDVAVDPPAILHEGKINMAVIRLPHISNFTDFQLLEREADVNLSYLSRPRKLDGLDQLILPGTKNVRSDLAWLKKSGWQKEIAKFVKNGGRLCGICGGYQMLGSEVRDPLGVEDSAGESAGLGLLNVKTVLEREKKLTRVRAKMVENSVPVSGYEIHVGKTRLGSSALPMFQLSAENGEEPTDGARCANGKIWGTYIHGVFDTPQFRNYFLNVASPEFDGRPSSTATADSFKQSQYDLLAAHFAKHLDIGAIARIAGAQGVNV